MRKNIFLLLAGLILGSPVVVQAGCNPCVCGLGGGKPPPPECKRDSKTPFAFNGISKDFELKASPGYECNPNEKSANNLFNCCVAQARVMRLDNSADLKTIHLRADPNLCRDPNLLDLRLELSEITDDGVHVYYLESPRIEETPFQSAQGYTTKFWLSFVPRFEFPAGQWEESSVPFISARIGVDELKPARPSNRIFGVKSWTVLGWKLVSQKPLSKYVIDSECPAPVSPHYRCRYQVEEFDETWVNQDSLLETSRIFTRWTYLGLD